MATQSDMELFSGNDAVLDCTFTDESSGLPLDLTGAQQLTYALSRKPNGTPAFVKQISSGVTITGAPQGEAKVSIDAADTEALSGVYYHEMRLVNSLGKKLTLMYGQVTISTNLIRD